MMGSQREAQRSAARSGGPAVADALSFIDQAELLLEQAREASRNGNMERAVVYAYRAGLRGAGALISFHRRGRRRLPAGSAWVRLLKLSPELEDWVKLFEGHARLASRADIGLERNISFEQLARVYSDAVDFVDFAREQVGYGVRAA